MTETRIKRKKIKQRVGRKEGKMRRRDWKTTRRVRPVMGLSDALAVPSLIGTAAENGDVRGHVCTRVSTSYVCVCICMCIHAMYDPRTFMRVCVARVLERIVASTRGAHTHARMYEQTRVYPIARVSVCMRTCVRIRRIYVSGLATGPV